MNYTFNIFISKIGRDSWRDFARNYKKSCTFQQCDEDEAEAQKLRIGEDRTPKRPQLSDAEWRSDSKAPAFPHPVRKSL